MHAYASISNITKIRVDSTRDPNSLAITAFRGGSFDDVGIHLHTQDPRIARLFREFIGGIDQLNMRPGSEDDYREIPEREADEDPIVSSGINARIAG